MLGDKHQWALLTKDLINPSSKICKRQNINKKQSNPNLAIWSQFCEFCETYTFVFAFAATVTFKFKIVCCDVVVSV